jgi:hypothetical protein
VLATWATGSGAGSGNTVQDTPSGASEDDGSGAAAGSGDVVRRAVKRPSILDP